MQLEERPLSASDTADVRGTAGCVASEIMQPHSSRHVTVCELQSAAEAGVRDGSGQTCGPVVRVLAGHAGAGASTLAAALADAADMAASSDPRVLSTTVHLIDAASPAWSGLAGASERDVGIRRDWIRGSRGRRVTV